MTKREFEKEKIANFKRHDRILKRFRKNHFFGSPKNKSPSAFIKAWESFGD